MGRTSFPEPGNFIDGGVGANYPRPSSDGKRSRQQLDARIQWLTNVRNTLSNERSVVTQEMRRNMSLYDDKHWETFGSNRRAPWKLPGVVNYAAWIADTKSALMADNRPKATFTTPKREDAYQAEILNAAWEEWWEEERIQSKVEVAAKLSVIRKIAYGKTGYDPAANGGKGAITLETIDGIAVYVNKEATSVHNAEILLHEYTLPVGLVIEKWKHLKGDADIFSGYDTEEEDESGEGNPSAGQETRAQPAQNYVDPEGLLQHTPPYAAPDSRGDFERDGKRCLIREVWTRPRGPQYQTKVDSIVFSVTGEVSTKPKLIEFDDGHQEPLQTVIMSNGIVYELPLSTVMVLQFAERYGGLQVVHAEDTLVAKTKEKTVPLYPTGRRMIAVGNVVADDGCNPFAHGRFPFARLPERPATKYYPRSSIDRVSVLQDCLNRMVSMVFDAAHLTANPIWRMPLNSDIADEEITNAPGAIMREDPQSLKLGKREKGPDMPAYVINFIQFIISQIRELSGLTETATGGKFKGQQAAETVSMYQEAANISLRPSLRAVEDFIVEIGEQFRGLVGQFYTAEKIVHYKDDAGIERHVPYIGTRLTANMHMRVKAGSMLPTSPSARLNYALQLINTPAYDIPELLRNLEEVGLIDSATRILRRLQQERSNPQLQWLIPALQPPGGKQKKKAKPSGGKSARASTPQKAGTTG
jgi:hypothetical protein